MGKKKLTGEKTSSPAQLNIGQIAQLEKLLNKKDDGDFLRTFNQIIQDDKKLLGDQYREYSLAAVKNWQPNKTNLKQVQQRLSMESLWVYEESLNSS